MFGDNYGFPNDPCSYPDYCRPFPLQDGFGVFAMYCLIKTVEALQEASTHGTPRVCHLAFRHKNPRVRKKNCKRLGLCIPDEK